MSPVDNTIRKSRLSSKNSKPKKKHLVKDNFGQDVVVRSKLEIKLGEMLTDYDVNWLYETSKIKYIIPASNHMYTADFTLPNGILLEGKGVLADYQERTKYVLLKQQNPEIDLRFVFDDPNKKCGGMKMTHSEWAIKHGFKYCGIRDIEQIRSWAKEKK